MSKAKKKAPDFRKSLDTQLSTQKMLADSMPTPLLVSMMNITIKMLAMRGIDIRDWDNRDKIVRSVRVLGGRHYFFATKNEPTEVHANGHIDSE